MLDAATAGPTQFAAFVTAATFPCIAGQAALKSGNCRVAEYGDMTSRETAEAIRADLIAFRHGSTAKAIFSTFVATFGSPAIRDQLHGSECFFRLLGNLRDSDREQGTLWCERVSSNVDNEHFALSVAGEAYFTPIFFEHAFYPPRRSPITFIVFNSMTTLDELRRRGAYDQLKSRIRENQTRSGITVDPRIGDHGVRREFPQYTLIAPELAAQERSLAVSILGLPPFP